MKSLILCLSILALAIAAASAQADPDHPIIPEHDGRPGCSTRYEFRRYFRNNFVPDQYWECAEWGVPARVRYCPVATKFQDNWQTCVPYNQWQWSPYVDPPTLAGDNNYVATECQELVLDRNECEVTPTTTNFPETTPTITTTTDSYGNETTTESTTTTPTTTTTPGDITTNTTPVFTTTTQIPLENRVCIGSSPNQWPGWVDCSAGPARDSCNMSSWNRRMATWDPNVYFQCTFPGEWILERCPAESCFDSSRNSCVHPMSWRQSCR